MCSARDARRLKQLAAGVADTGLRCGPQAPRWGGGRTGWLNLQSGPGLASRVTAAEHRAHRSGEVVLNPRRLPRALNW